MVAFVVFLARSIGLNTQRDKTTFFLLSCNIASLLSLLTTSVFLLAVLKHFVGLFHNDDDDERRRDIVIPAEGVEYR